MCLSHVARSPLTFSALKSSPETISAPPSQKAPRLLRRLFEWIFTIRTRWSSNFEPSAGSKPRSRARTIDDDPPNATEGKRLRCPRTEPTKNQTDRRMTWDIVHARVRHVRYRGYGWHAVSMESLIGANIGLEQAKSKRDET